MAQYSYQGRNAAGEVVSGKIVADSKEGAATKLMQSGIIPTHIEISESRVDWLAIANIQIIKTPPRREEISAFCRQLYALYKAGIPLSTAISRISQHIRNVMFREALGEVAKSLEGGLGLGKAFDNHPKVFPRLFCKIVTVGESTGQLEAALMQLSQHLELEGVTVKRVKSVVRYPMIVITAIVIAFVIINVFVVPVFASFFKRFDAQLPWATRFLIGTSDFVTNYWPLILMMVVGLFALFKSYVGTPHGKEKWHYLQLRMPLIGNILERILFARFCRMMAMIFKTDLSLPYGLELTADAIGNVYMGSRIYKMRSDIARGESLLKSSLNSGMFSPLVLQMISVGEETGKLEDMFIQVAEFYEGEVEYDIKKLSDAIEPILLAVIGAMVLLLALGVFMPMWSLTKVIKR